MIDKLPKALLLSALILSTALLLSNLLTFPRYEVIRMNEADAFRLDRWTGQMAACGYEVGVQAFCTTVNEYEKLPRNQGTSAQPANPASNQNGSSTTEDLWAYPSSTPKSENKASAD